jgi:hypothetical protein
MNAFFTARPVESAEAYRTRVASEWHAELHAMPSYVPEVREARGVVALYALGIRKVGAFTVTAEHEARAAMQKARVAVRVAQGGGR